MACCALNTSEIVIFGGRLGYTESHPGKDTSDVFIFDIETNSVQKMNTVEHP